jgi:long-chain fatty acid transport protein
MKRSGTIHPSVDVTVALVLAAIGGDAFAAGFQLQEQNASGLGLAYSGMAVATQDASVVFWNPAGMAFMPGSEVTLAANYIIPSFEFSSSGPPPGGSTYNAFGNGGDAGVSTWVPSLYGRMQLAPRLSAGLAVNAPFGLTTEWDSRWAGMFHAVKSKVETLNVNPGVAWQVNGFLSVGAGVSYQRLKATLTNAVTPLIPTAQGRLDGDDWAWGWNIGGLLDFGQGTRVGLTYRSSIDYRLSGKLAFNNPALAALGSSAEADLKLPQVVSVAVTHRFTPELRFLGDFTWTGWNSVQGLAVRATSGPAAGSVVANTALNFQSSWRTGVGAEYQASRLWMVRVGGAYDRTPVQDAFRTPRLPDSDRKWLAVGARFEPDERWLFDFGYAYLWVNRAASNLDSAGPVPGTLRGSYTANTHILGAQVSMRF